MNNEELFEALSELDDELIAKAKHIDTYGEQTVVLRRTPVWKIVTGFVAAAACVAVLAVGGVLGMKYINGKNAVSPPSDSSGDVLHRFKEYTPAKYPEEAKYVYSGDYSELTMISPVCIDYVEYYDSIIRLEEKSDLIVIGEFTDDPHQTNDPKVDGTYTIYGGDSFNMFRVDRVIKGNCVEGQTILICQDGVVTNGYFHCNDNFTPMLKGDKWIYFLRKSSDREMYFPLHDTGRFPVPGSEHEFVLNDNVYGMFGVGEKVVEIYEDIKERFNDWTYEEYFESEYPDGTELYDGDYSGLKLEETFYAYGKEVLPYDSVFDDSKFIVTGEFIDDTRQWFTSYVDGFSGRSYNKFRVDKVFKGDIKAGQIIIIEQDGFVVDNTYYAGDNLTPMINGDKWLYYLSKSKGIFSAYRDGNGRYPLPGSQNKSLDFGEFGVINSQYANTKMYERLLTELGITGMSVSENFDGVVLSVMLEDSTFDVKDNIRVKAIVRNTTDKPIGLLTPVLGDGSHTEISTNISRGRCGLIDIDVADKCFNDALGSYIVQPGEEYVQEMMFNVRLYDSIPAPGYETGEYKGTATIKLLSDPNDVTSEVTERVVEFSLNIVDKNSDTSVENDPPSSVMFDQFEEEYVLKDEKVRFTMPEFEGAEFECDLYGVFMDGKTLYGASFINSLYLCDLNGDGKRELISSVNYFGANGEYGIKVCDVANGGKLWYLRDYTVTLSSGWALVAVPRTTSDLSRELTFDLLTEYPEPEELVNRPVKNYGEFEDLSRVLGHEDKYRFFYKYKNAPENEPVYSTLNGEVVEAGANKWNSGYGNYIAILGEDGYYYYYSALGDITAAVGDKVTAGTQIGTVGSSARWHMEDGLGVRYTCTEQLLDLSDPDDEVVLPE